MLGVGMGYAAEPLLEDLKTVDPVRHSEAVVRSTEFFNCNPNLAGLALGATARAEYEAVPGAQIARLRTALCSPLGALGDELFWAGMVPALVGLALAAAVLGAGWWAIGGLLLVYNLFRLATGVWALRTGYDAGMKVGRGHRARRGCRARLREIGVGRGVHDRPRDSAGGDVVSFADSAGGEGSARWRSPPWASP